MLCSIACPTTEGDAFAHGGEARELGGGSGRGELQAAKWLMSCDSKWFHGEHVCQRHAVNQLLQLWVQALLKFGAQINARNLDEVTPLLAAAQEGQQDWRIDSLTLWPCSVLVSFCATFEKGLDSVPQCTIHPMRTLHPFGH